MNRDPDTPEACFRRYLAEHDRPLPEAPRPPWHRGPVLWALALVMVGGWALALWQIAARVLR